MHWKAKGSVSTTVMLGGLMMGKWRWRTVRAPTAFGAMFFQTKRIQSMVFHRLAGICLTFASFLPVFRGQKTQTKLRHIFFQSHDLSPKTIRSALKNTHKISLKKHFFKNQKKERSFCSEFVLEEMFFDTQNVFVEDSDARIFLLFHYENAESSGRTF